MSNENLVEIKDLTIFKNKKSNLVVDNLNLSILRSKIYGFLGESNSGKSIVGSSLIRYIPKNLSIKKGHIFFKNHDLLKISLKEINGIKSSEIGFIPKNSEKFFFPFLSLDKQLNKLLKYHSMVKNSVNNYTQLISILKLLGILKPKKILKQYPSNLSISVLKKISIAFALSFSPELLIADQLFNVFDTIDQNRIGNLLKKLVKSGNITVLLISDNIDLLSILSDIIVVFYNGVIVEYGDKSSVLKNPKHPYTTQLLNSWNHFTQPDLLDQNKMDKKILENIKHGCKFYLNCNLKNSNCLNPFDFIKFNENHWVKCCNLK